MSLDGFEILEPTRTQKKSVGFDRNGRITFSDGVLNELDLPDNCSVELRWKIEKTDIEKTNQDGEKTTVPTTTTKQLAFIFGDNGGAKLCDPKVGNTKHITATSYLDRQELRQLMRGVKYRYDAINIDGNSNAVIVDLLSKGKNKIVS